MHLLSNVAFGELDTAALTATIESINKRMEAESGYQYCRPTQKIAEYATADLSKVKPELDFKLDEVKEFEACGDRKTRELASLILQFSDEDAKKNLEKILNISGLSRDISDFKNYLQVKMQVTKGWTTPQFNDWYYREYWGDDMSFLRASRLASEEGMRRETKQQAMATLAKSFASTQLSGQYMDFYLEMSSKYGPKFTMPEQKRLKEFFIETTVYEWKVGDFISIGELLQKHLSHEDLAKFYMFIPMAVTGYYFEDAEKSPTAYMARVKSFSDAGEKALREFLGPFRNTSTISMESASEIAARCQNNAACIANYFADLQSGAVQPPSVKIGKIPPIVYVAATGFVLWKLLK